MMRIAVTGSMGQVATSLIVQAGREFEIVLLGRAYSCSRIALLFSLGRGGQRRCLHRRRPSRRVVRSTGFRLIPPISARTPSLCANVFGRFKRLLRLTKETFVVVFERAPHLVNRRSRFRNSSKIDS